MDHNDKRNTSVPLGTFEPTENPHEQQAEHVETADASPHEGREDTWPNFTVGSDRPRRRTRTLMGVPGLASASLIDGDERDSQPSDSAERPTVPYPTVPYPTVPYPTVMENISQAIAEELAGQDSRAAAPNAAQPLQVSRVDPEFDPDAQEVTTLYESEIVALADSTPPPARNADSRQVLEADGGEPPEAVRPSLIEVAPPESPELGEVPDFNKTLQELPPDLAGGVPLLTDHVRPSALKDRSSEPATRSELADLSSIASSHAAVPSAPPMANTAGFTSLAPREVTRQAPARATQRDTTSRNGALLVAAVMLLATGGWFLTAGTFRRATISEAPAAAPATTTAAVAQPAMNKPAEPQVAQPAATSETATAAATAAPQEAVAANATSARHGAPGTPPSASAVSGAPKTGKALTATSRSLRVKQAPQPKPALVPPGNDMPEQPSRTQVLERLESVRSSVRACAAGRSGVADLDITIAKTGTVMHVLVGGDFAGTTEGSCIARAVRTARFPSFKQERFRLLFPYAI